MRFLSSFQISKTWLLLAAACFLGIALPACAQNVTQDPAQNSSETQNPNETQNAKPTYPVRGVVLNSLTSQPIARALVHAQGSAVLTDGEGRFELNLPEGTEPIVVRRPMYSTRGQETNYLLNVGAGMPDLTFYLTPQASITGHITLSSGDEADDVHVTAFHKANLDGRDRWMTGSMTSTDTEGSFHLVNLTSPASWVLCTMPSRDTVGLGSIGKGVSPATDFGYPSVCYPGPLPSADSANATNTISLSPGQQAEIELTMVRQPFYRVDIAVPNSGRSEGPGLQIHDGTGRIVGFPAQWRAELGAMEVYLPSGRYYAEASLQQGSSHLYGRVDFQVANGPLAGLSMTLLPLHPIAVDIRRDFTAANQGDGANGVTGITNQSSTFKTSSIVTDPGVNLTLASADSAMFDLGGGGLSPRKGASDPSQFELDSVVPGRYWVNIFAYEGYVASITSGGVDLTREPLIIGPGNTVAPIQITLRNDTGQLNCTIHSPAAAPDTPRSASGQPLGQVSVYYAYAIPLSRTVAQNSQTQGDGSAPLSILNLAPGTYRVVAFDKMQQFDVSDPQDMARITRAGQTVTVAAGATVSVQLDLVHVQGPGADGSVGDSEL